MKKIKTYAIVYRRDDREAYNIVSHLKAFVNQRLEDANVVLISDRNIDDYDFSKIKGLVVVLKSKRINKRIIELINKFSNGKMKVPIVSQYCNELSKVKSIPICVNRKKVSFKYELMGRMVPGVVNRNTGYYMLKHTYIVNDKDYNMFYITGLLYFMMLL